MTRADVDYYELLGLDHGATTDEIRSAYRSAIHLVHPDLAGDAGAALSKALNLAYETLSDPAKRAAYDATDQDEETPSAPEAATEPESPQNAGDEWETEWADVVPDPDPTPDLDDPAPPSAAFLRSAGASTGRRVLLAFVRFVLVLSAALSVLLSLSTTAGDFSTGAHPTNGTTWAAACFLGVDLVVVASLRKRKWAQEVAVVAGIALLVWLSKVQAGKVVGLTVVPAAAPWIIGAVAWVSVALLTQHRRSNEQ